MIPFESFNILYRDARTDKLEEIRGVLQQGFAARKSTVINNNYKINLVNAG